MYVYYSLVREDSVGIAPGIASEPVHARATEPVHGTGPRKGHGTSHATGSRNWSRDGPLPPSLPFPSEGLTGDIAKVTTEPPRNSAEISPRLSLREKSLEILAEKSAEKSSEKSSEISAEKSSEISAEKSSEISRRNRRRYRAISSYVCGTGQLRDIHI